MSIIPMIILKYLPTLTLSSSYCFECSRWRHYQDYRAKVHNDDVSVGFGIMQRRVSNLVLSVDICAISTRNLTIRGLPVWTATLKKVFLSNPLSRATLFGSRGDALRRFHWLVLMASNILLAITISWLFLLIRTFQLSPFFLLHLSQGQPPNYLSWTCNVRWPSWILSLEAIFPALSKFWILRRQSSSPRVDSLITDR